MDSYCCTEEIEECPTETLRFRPVKKEDIVLLQSYFNRYPSRSDDFTVGGVLMWSDYFDYKYAEINNSLVIMGHLPDEDLFLFYYPCGEIIYDKYKNLIANYCNQNKISGFILEPIESIVSTNEYLSSSNDNGFVDNWKEYLYDIEKFCSFSGKKLEKKRNHLNYFLNNFSPFTVETIDESLISELIAYTIRFNTVHKDNELAQYECRQVLEVLRDFSLYPFEGIALRKDNEIIGFSLGEKIGDTFFVHIEKGNISMRGSYQAIASCLAKYVANKYPDVKYLNREEDMGEESLRKNKESYHPSLFIHKKRNVISL